ncbi:MAG: lysostaphin resistance A-like protein [Bacteroidota bacterium]|jgi:membrane protease YdiL (CAAX protease family)
MKGLLAHRPPLNQLITLVAIALVSFFSVAMIGTIALQALTGISVDSLSDLSPAQLSKPGMLTFLRGMQFVQFIGLFVLPAWICSQLFSYEPNRFLGFQAPNLSQFWFWSILIMIILLPFTQFIGELNQRIVFPGGMKEWMQSQEKSAEQTVKALLSAQSLNDLFLNLFFVAVLAGVGEELLFRGLIQRILVRKYGRWTGIVIAAILFSAMHMQFYGFFPRFLLGVVLGILFAYSGSLWVAILAHFFYDAMLITAAYVNPDLLEAESVIPLLQLIAPALISLLLSVWVIRQMIQRSNEFPPQEPTYVTEDPENPFRS